MPLITASGGGGTETNAGQRASQQRQRAASNHSQVSNDSQNSINPQQQGNAHQLNLSLSNNGRLTPRPSDSGGMDNNAAYDFNGQALPEITPPPLPRDNNNALYPASLSRRNKGGDNPSPAFHDISGSITGDKDSVDSGSDSQEDYLSLSRQKRQQISKGKTSKLLGVEYDPSGKPLGANGNRRPPKGGPRVDNDRFLRDLANEADDSSDSASLRGQVKQVENPTTKFKWKEVFSGGLMGAVAGLVAGAGTTGIAALVGSALGTCLFPGVGTVIGAAIGAGIGVAAGALYGAVAGKLGTADLLDTQSNSFINRYARNRKYNPLRMLAPTAILKGVARMLPMMSRRSLLGQAYGWVGTGIKKCLPKRMVKTHDIKMENWGKKATSTQSKEHFRYAAAMDSAYQIGRNQEFTALKNSDAYRNHWNTEVERRSINFSASPNTLSISDMRNRIDSKFQHSSDAKVRKEYTFQHGLLLSARQKLAAADRINQTKGSNNDCSWNYSVFQEPTRYTAPDNPKKAIWDRLPASLQKSLRANNGVFFDQRTGNFMRFYFDKQRSEFIIAHMGSLDPSLKSPNTTGSIHWSGNVAQWAGGVPPSVKQACAVGAAIRKAVAGYNHDQRQIDGNHRDITVTSVGHSRGGLMAQAEALKNNGKAVVMNSEAMGVGVRQYVGMLRDRRKPKDTEIIQLSSKGDWVSNSRFWSGVGSAAEFIGIPTPMNAGKQLVVPNGAGLVNHHADATAHMAAGVMQ